MFLTFNELETILDHIFVCWPDDYCSRTEPGFSSPFCHLMEFGFLVTVSSSLLSWRHLIFNNNIIDLTLLTLLYELDNNPILCRTALKIK